MRITYSVESYTNIGGVWDVDGLFPFLFCSLVRSVLATISISNCIFGSVDAMYLAFYDVFVECPYFNFNFYIRSFDMLTGYLKSIV